MATEPCEDTNNYSNTKHSKTNNKEHRTMLHKKKLIRQTIDQIIARFERDNINGINIKYHNPSIKDRILVEQYMIPTMIYEEAQGNAMIRTLKHHKNSRNEKLPEFQEIIDNLFVGLNTQLQRI